VNVVEREGSGAGGGGDDKCLGERGLGVGEEAEEKYEVSKSVQGCSMGWVRVELGVGVVEMGLNDMAASLQLNVHGRGIAGVVGGNGRSHEGSIPYILLTVKSGVKWGVMGAKKICDSWPFWISIRPTHRML
jgi:hypothetical protein